MNTSAKIVLSIIGAAAFVIFIAWFVVQDARIATLELNVRTLEKKELLVPQRNKHLIRARDEGEEWEPIPKGWPRLEETTFIVSQELVNFNCGAPEKLSHIRMGCAQIHFDSRTCLIFISNAFPYAFESTKDHERMHCKGHDHKGSNRFKEAWNEAQGNYDVSYELLAQDISRRFHVSETYALQIVTSAYDSGARTRVDPLVLLAIIRVESSFNPVAQGTQGDIGLMQLHPKWQMDKIIEAGGLLAAWQPETNILIGAQVLRRCMKHHNLVSALQCYNGNSIYPGKVINEQIYLKGIASGKTTRSRH